MIAEKNNREKLNNIKIAAGLVFFLFLLLSLLFDFYYDLNDDVVIRDILSGRYTGEPEGRTNQLLFALGSILALGYRMFPGLPVFSLFLSLSLGVSLFMIYYRSLCYWKKRKTKVAGSLVLLVVSGVFLMKELVGIQYTAVCGILCGASCFWFLTTPCGLEKKEYWKKNLPALGGITIAFGIRSEMVLLCLPFAGLCGFLHWMEEVKEIRDNSRDLHPPKIREVFLTKNHLIKYPLFLVCLLGIMGILLMIEGGAYRRGEWREFRSFFDARTKVYDYTWYPSYEKEEKFYEENGISRVQYELIDNYNFGLDEEITAQTLKTIAEFNEKEKHLGGKAWKIKYFIREMVKLPISYGEFPYNCYVFLAYGLVVLLAVLQKRKWDYGWKIGLLVVVRSISWGYLIWSQRVVERISHPLYFLEFLILMAFLVKESYDRPLWNSEKYYRFFAAAALLLTFLAVFPQKKEEIHQELVRREKVLQKQSNLELYTKVHPKNYYYIDVYSMVDFTGKLYEKVDNSKRNYDFLGGWICKSPLQEKAKKEYLKEKETSIAKALLQENFYFIMEEEGDPSFLENYYREKEIFVEIEKIDQIEGTENPFQVYRVLPVEEGR